MLETGGETPQLMKCCGCIVNLKEAVRDDLCLAGSQRRSDRLRLEFSRFEQTALPDLARVYPLLPYESNFSRFRTGRD